MTEKEISEKVEALKKEILDNIFKTDATDIIILLAMKSAFLQCAHFMAEQRSSCELELYIGELMHDCGHILIESAKKRATFERELTKYAHKVVEALNEAKKIDTEKEKQDQEAKVLH